MLFILAGRMFLSRGSYFLIMELNYWAILPADSVLVNFSVIWTESEVKNRLSFPRDLNFSYIYFFLPSNPLDLQVIHSLSFLRIFNDFFGKKVCFTVTRVLDIVLFSASVMISWMIFWSSSSMLDSGNGWTFFHMYGFGWRFCWMTVGRGAEWSLELLFLEHMVE